MVTTSITTGDDEIYDVRVDQDGGVLAAGVAGDRFAVVRYQHDGSLDPTFGDAGVLVTTAGFGDGAQVTAIRLQPDGRLIVAGIASRVAGFQVMRFGLDGAPDPTFGGTGTVVTTIPDAEWSAAYALLPQGDGRIVVGGVTGEGENSRFCLVRYLADGSLDTAFGLGGIVENDIRPFYSEIHALARQRDGKIVAAGWTDRYDHPDALAMARYRPNGRPDPTFSGDGAAVFGLGKDQDSSLLTVATHRGWITAGGETGMDGSANTVGVVIRVRQ